MAAPEPKSRGTVTVSAKTARERFDEMLDTVRESGRSVVVERAGHSEAVIISMDDFQNYRRLQRAEEVPNWAERAMELHQRIAEDWQGPPLRPGEIDEMIEHGQR